MTTVALTIGYLVLGLLVLGVLILLLVATAAVRDHVTGEPADRQPNLLDFQVRTAAPVVDDEEQAWAKLAELIDLEDERRARATVVDMRAWRAERHPTRPIGGAA